MTVAGASQPLMKAVGARREMQHHLDCLTRQIAARRKTGDDVEGPEAS
ncbi:hypothetical protein [Rhizobium sp. ARZ01]|nr:hypothetical protein [Rhizobium sp. ARZ01]